MRSQNSISNLGDLLWKAVDVYERAAQLDPNFAVAWARLCRANADLCFNRVDTATSGRGDWAKRALQNAQRLEPNSPETLLALGYYEYWVLRDYRATTTIFGYATKIFPSNIDALFALGLITRRAGHWDQSIAYFEQALALDPPTQHECPHESSMDLRDASTIPRRA